MPHLDSDALYWVDYDPRASALTAIFKQNHRTYVYDAVPKRLYEELLEADSRGAFFNLHIRPFYSHREIKQSGVRRGD